MGCRFCAGVRGTGDHFDGAPNVCRVVLDPEAAEVCPAGEQGGCPER